MNLNRLKMNEIDYRHKKFDAYRIAPVATSTPKRKRFDSIGSDESELSMGTENIVRALPKYLKFSLEEENDSGISVSANVSPVSLTNEVIEGQSPIAKMDKLSVKVPVSVKSEILAKKLPKISTTKLARISKYHGNMVRQFPAKQRTAKDQERRDKNTLACRQSRFFKKLEYVVAEDEYKDNLQKFLETKKETIRYCLYAQELLKLCAEEENDDKHTIPSDVQEINKRKLFTIEHLLST